MKNIETGVDKLVQLIEVKKRVSVESAAKTLGVSTVLVQEWADFLEEDSLISIEYSLSSVYLVERKLSKKEVEKKEKEFEGKKDSFIRRVETTLKTLDKDTLGFEKLKEEFNNLKKEIGGEIEYVRKELKELEYFDKLKKEIDHDITEQKIEYEKLLEKSHLEIKGEERRYQEMIAQIAREREKVIRDRKEIKSLEAKEDDLASRIQQINRLISDIKSRLKEENHNLEVSEQNVEKLELFVEQIEHRMKSKKHDSILPLIRVSEDHRGKIVHLQNQMIEKLQKKKEDITQVKNQSEKVYKNLSKFFEKKESADKLLNKIQEQKKELSNEYDTLIKKAQAFNAYGKKVVVDKHVEELMIKYREIEGKRSKLHKNISELSHIIKG